MDNKKKSKVLSVRLSGTPVGHLMQTKDGKMRFEYLSDAKESISLSMPTSQKTYGNMPCEKYFGALLPESEDAKKAIAREFNANPKSTFSLIRAIGHDCAGAISLNDPDDPIEIDSFHHIIVNPISDEELERHILELPQRPLFLGAEGARMSLAGVQDKAPVCIVGGKICLPRDGTPTTHILKPTIPKYSLSVQNEFICLRTAAKLGLPTAKVSMGSAGSQVFLLVERYDRVFNGKDQILRLHQEDFCQALSAREKYQVKGGPGFLECFDLMMNTSLPLIDRNVLMQAVVFNYLIGNADAHAKNFSLLYTEPSKVRLAPFYDILCTQFYDSVATAMGMRIGQEYELGRVTLNDWKALCDKIKFPFSTLERIVEKQIDTLVDAVGLERLDLQGTTFEDAALDKLVDKVKANCARAGKVFNAKKL